MGRTADISRAATIYAALLLPFSGLAFTNVALGEFQYLPVTFFRSKDLPVLAIVMALFLIVRVACIPDKPVVGMETLFGRMKLLPHSAPVLLIFLLALLGAFGLLGSYPLSMDEDRARADGYALVRGRAMAEAKTSPIICLVLAATSAQWIITGITSFAMSAYLFFNLA